ncbi:hypothetical protein [Roseovarius sp. D22-M7]|uniref:hypothetical protein n=1 Tax=Roseovarius sp. D22-M7 TaxID=3127116 RepID=UPI0030104706
MTNQNAITYTTEAVEETITQATGGQKAGAKKPTKKPRKPPNVSSKPTAKKETKAKEAKEEKATPERATLKDAEGNEYALAEGVDPEKITADADEAQAAFEAVNNKEADLLNSYLVIGRFQSDAKKAFKSTKLFGQYLAQALPVSQALDPALRSNCTWLYEALNVTDHEASDLLHILNVNDIASFKSANPTVIKREYKKVKKEKEEKDKAEQEGYETVEEAKEAEKAAKAEQEKKEQAAKKRQMTKLEKRIKAFLMQHEDLDEMATEAASLLRDVLETDAKEQVEKIDSIVG